MPHKWLQIKGDPSVRDFLFQQSRVDSLLDRIHRPRTQKSSTHF